MSWQTMKEDLAVLKGLVEAGKATPVIDRSYRLSDVADALRHQGKGHVQGKIMVVVSGTMDPAR